MQSILSLPLLPGPLWPEAVAPDRVLSMGQIEQCKTKLFKIELFLHLTACLQKTGGAGDVMGIVLGNGHGVTSSKPGRDCLHST